jgi:hypothetical protein
MVSLDMFSISLALRTCSNKTNGIPKKTQAAVASNMNGKSSFSMFAIKVTALAMTIPPMLCPIKAMGRFSS